MKKSPEDMGLSPEVQEESQYTLVAEEGASNEGTRRGYLPVLSERVDEYYQVSQCEVTDITGSLEYVLEEAEKRAEEDYNSGNYIGVSTETPEQRANRRPVDGEFVLPQE